MAEKKNARRSGQADALKIVGTMLAAVVTVLFTWAWRELESLENRKVDKSAIEKVWTIDQQDEYRAGVMYRIDGVIDRLSRLERENDAADLRQNKNKYSQCP